MANLFYKVTNERADQFKTSMAQEGVIGFVDGDGFGYLLANGHQYGPTKSQLTSLIGNVAKPTVSTSSTKFKDQDGNEISLVVGLDGKLLLSKYTAANWTTLSITAPITNKKDATVEYGTSYMINCSVEFSNNTTVSYTISAGTETISDRKVSLTYFYNGTTVTNEVTLSTNSGTFTIDLSGCSSYSGANGIAITGKSISAISKSAQATGNAIGSIRGRFAKVTIIPPTDSGAALIVQERWIQHTADITVSTAGTQIPGSGLTLLTGTVTTGTKNFVNLGFKPTSFIATKDQKCYLAFKKTWGTPSFKDPNGFDNTAWKLYHDISIYDTNDYSVYVFIGADGNPTNMNAAGAGTWKVSFKS